MFEQLYLPDTNQGYAISHPCFDSSYYDLQCSTDMNLNASPVGMLSAAEI